MTLSPDQTYLIFTNGGNIFVQLNSSLGTPMSSQSLGTYIGTLYAVGISGDSTVAVLGGRDYSTSYY